MVKKLIIIGTFLFLFRILYSSENYSLFTSNTLTAIKDSVIVITDSLIWNEVNLNTLQNVSIAGLAVTSVPIGIINGFGFLLEFGEYIGKTAWIGPLAGLIGYPAFFTWSIIDIKKTKAKRRLLDKYQDCEVVDKSSFNHTHISSYHCYVGINYASFRTSNASENINLSFGIRYTYPINRFLAFSTGISISKKDIWLRGKRYYDYWWMEEKVKVVDINHKGVEFYFPFFIKFSIPISNTTEFYCLVGSGFASRAFDSKVNYISDIEGESNYDYGHFDGPLKKPGKLNSVCIGLTRKKMFFEIGWMQDTNNTYRLFDHIIVDDKLFSYRFIVGYQLPIK